MSAETATQAPVLPKPVRAAALWVGDLAPNVTETILDNLFASTGSKPVNVRVCRNVQTRESLGYAYVNYQNVAEAEKAMNDLNYTLIEGRSCRIMWSQRDPAIRRSQVGNVFIKNLGPDVDSKQLYDALRNFGTILSCKVSTDEAGKSRGYGFVHFETEQSANDAIEKVHGMTFNNHVIQVTQYVSREKRSGPEWKNIYIKNFPKSFTQKDLLDLFAQYGQITSHSMATDETGQPKGFAFICYSTHASAVEAVEKLNGKEMEGDAYMPSTKTPEEASRKLHLFVGRAQTKAERDRIKIQQYEAARRERASKTAGCNLYVRHLHESITADGFRDLFTPFGTITSAKLAVDADGVSKLHGFVCYSNQDEASKAQQAMNGKMVKDKPLLVVPFKSKEERVQNQTRNAVNTRAAMPPTMPQNMMGNFGMQPFFNLMMSFANSLNSAATSNNPVMQNYAQQIRVMQQNMSRQMAVGGRPVMQNGNNFSQVFSMMQQMGGQQMGQRNQRQGQPRQQARQQGAPRTAQQGAPRPAPANAPAKQSYRNAATARNAEGMAPQATTLINQQVETALQQQLNQTADPSAFTSQLANADPIKRRQMLGEKIFPQIYKIDQVRAGKITGMLLEGMEESEILRLTESPEELAERVVEAQGVLESEAQA